MNLAYDALLVVSFGGPDGPEDVLPFLENVLRGRNVPRERVLEVAGHYLHFDGKSPINEQNRTLVAAIERELAANCRPLPVYWGNRNWHPLLPDVLRQMAADGVSRALAFVTSAYSSYSGCRQYREDIARAREEVGRAAPVVDKLRVFFNHPGFIEPMIESTRRGLEAIPAERRDEAPLVFTAHSVPLLMAEGSRYVEQLQEACRLVAEGVPHANWQLAYQSRSGPPHQPWLGPDVGEVVTQIQERALQSQEEMPSGPSGKKAENTTISPEVVVVPIGFLSDHMEVVFDLDFELRQHCDSQGVHLVRAATVGAHPRFVRMIRELIEERTGEPPERLSLGSMGASHDSCPEDCCLYAPRKQAQAGGVASSRAI